MPKKKTPKTPSAPAVDRAAACSLTPRTDAVVASLPQNERGEITFAGIRGLIRLCETLEAELSDAPCSACSACSAWKPIATAPRDGSIIDLWIADGRVTDCYYGRPQHSCGEMGQYCDSCPAYDGWVDDFIGYLTGEDGIYSVEPTHWMAIPPAPPNAIGEAQPPAKKL